MRVVLVEDEPVARRGLRRELARIPGVECIAECASRDEAITAIIERRPDVVLLDVQLGRGTAFEIIEEIGADAMPLVVFVTAYDRHALKAFEVHALDYVLKPVDPARLREALERGARQIDLQQGASLADRLEGLLSKQSPNTDWESRPAPVTHRLVVRDGDRLSFLEIDLIDWFESAGNYVQVHSGGRTYLLRTTMERVAHRVAGRGTFVRVRRSALVNVKAVTTLERYAKGMYVVHLRNGTRVISSRYHQAGLRNLLRVDE
jgi:two-component system LytT family response regulator